jgi:hypothetical protein
MAAGGSTPAATDSSPPPGVISGWPFRAQPLVRTAAAPEGAFSAQTPPARLFSYPTPTLPRRVPTAYGVSATTRHRHRPHSITALLHPPSAGCLARLAVKSRQAATFRSDGWLAAIRCLDVGSLTAIPCRYAAGRTTFKGSAGRPGVRSPSEGRGWWPRAGPMSWRNWHGMPGSRRPSPSRAHQHDQRGGRDRAGPTCHGAVRSYDPTI